MSENAFRRGGRKGFWLPVFELRCHARLLARPLEEKGEGAHRTSASRYHLTVRRGLETTEPALLFVLLLVIIAPECFFYYRIGFRKSCLCSQGVLSCCCFYVPYELAQFF
jgi:hypothetical protein